MKLRQNTDPSDQSPPEGIKTPQMPDTVPGQIISFYDYM